MPDVDLDWVIRECGELHEQAREVAARNETPTESGNGVMISGTGQLARMIERLTDAVIVLAGGKK